MGELNIARQLLKARHEKKITQEELASYIGVSKAAVSKWESGISFPDITLLPRLATYYNMSIDELMGYEPQMTKEEIKKTYHELKKRFAQEPCDEVMKVCTELEKKYYSCFPFLLQLVVLYINHAMLNENPKNVYQHCIELTERIRTLGDDVNDAKEACTLEVSCYLLLGEPMKALDLMDEQLRPISQDAELLGQIYYSIGNIKKAQESYQVAMYQHLLLLVGDSLLLLLIYANDRKRVQEIIDRTSQVMKTYHIDELHPNTAASFYLTAARAYCINQQNDKAIEMLEQYTNLFENHLFSLLLHGDEFFDEIEQWFQNFELGNQAPRSEKLIYESIIAAVEKDEVFACLRQNEKYRGILRRLGKFVCRNEKDLVE